MAEIATFVSQKMFYAVGDMTDWSLVDMNPGTKGLEEVTALCKLASKACVHLKTFNDYCQKKTVGHYNCPVRFYEEPFHEYKWNHLRTLEMPEDEGNEMEGESRDTERRYPYFALCYALRSNNFPALETFVHLSMRNKLNVSVFSMASLPTLTTLILAVDESIIFENEANVFPWDACFESASSAYRNSVKRTVQREFPLVPSIGSVCGRSSVSSRPIAGTHVKMCSFHSAASPQTTLRGLVLPSPGHAT